MEVKPFSPRSRMYSTPRVDRQRAWMPPSFLLYRVAATLEAMAAMSRSPLISLALISWLSAATVTS